MRKSICRYVRNEAGLTLVELLASLTIFIVILIPLSSVYLSGITTYGKTQVQTSLRNEADFIIGDIMNTLQDASYFDLDDGTDNTNSKEDIFAILRSAHVISETDSTSFKKAIATYKREVNYETLPSSSTEKVPVSILNKKLFQLAPSTGIYSSFSYDPSYLVYGLFRIVEDNINPNSKKVAVYLIIAPRAQNSGNIQNGQKTAFTNLQEIKEEVERIQPIASGGTSSTESNVLFNYIYMVRTEISVNSLSQE